MDWIVILGVTSLGSVIGGLVCHYVARTKIFRIKELSSAVSILAGAGVIAIFHFLGGGGAQKEYWFYPVGLLLGFIVIGSLNIEDE